MCTSIVEIVDVEGMAKRGDEWFPLTRAVVAYDHARHAPLADVITLDFINTGLEPWRARFAIELTLESAKELRAALDRAITAADFPEESEVRARALRAPPRSGSEDATCRANFQPVIATASSGVAEATQGHVTRPWVASISASSQ